LGLGCFAFVVGKLEVDEEVGSHQARYLYPACVLWKAELLGEKKVCILPRCICLTVQNLGDCLEMCIEM